MPYKTGNSPTPKGEGYHPMPAGKPKPVHNVKKVGPIKPLPR
jgi:hypothetical protein